MPSKYYPIREKRERRNWKREHVTSAAFTIRR